MNRLRNGDDQPKDPKDRNEINEHYAEPNGNFVVNSDTATACATNLKRNTMEFMAWSKHLVKNHPEVESNKLPPDSALFIECSTRQNKRKSSRVTT